MESLKHKIASHVGSTTEVAIHFTADEMKHLHDMFFPPKIVKESNASRLPQTKT